MTVFGDESAINASMVIVMAAVGTVVASGPLWVPGVCAAAAGLHWEHLRSRAFHKMVVNTACLLLAALGSAGLGRLVYHLISPIPVAVVLAALIATTTYWIVDNSLLAVVLSCVDGESFRSRALELTTSETELIPIAGLGFGVGYAFSQVVSTPALVASLAFLILLANGVVWRSTLRERLRPWLVALSSAVALVAFAGASANVANSSAQPSALAIAWLAVAGALGAALALRVDHRAGRAALVTVATASIVTFHANYSVIAPILVTSVASIPLLMSCHDHRKRARLYVSVALAITTATIATAGLPGFLSGSLVGTAAIALVGSVAWTLGWHVPVLRDAVRGPKLGLLAAFDVVRADGATFVLAGLVGGAIGWTRIPLSSYGAAALMTTLVLGLAVFVWIRRHQGVTPSEALNDNEVLGLVECALLDLPASSSRGR